jgi:hypothetical protein
MTLEEQLIELLPLHNCDRDGVDSTKRALAIEILVGPPDGWQTDRLAAFALGMSKLKGLKL